MISLTRFGPKSRSSRRRDLFRNSLKVSPLQRPLNSSTLMLSMLASKLLTRKSKKILNFVISMAQNSTDPLPQLSTSNTSSRYLSIKARWRWPWQLTSSSRLSLNRINRASRCSQRQEQSLPLCYHNLLVLKTCNQTRSSRLLLRTFNNLNRSVSRKKRS